MHAEERGVVFCRRSGGMIGGSRLPGSRDRDRRENSMNWDRIEGNWTQAVGKVKERWVKLTDDDLDVIAGERDQLVGAIQARYGIAKEAAEEQVEEFVMAYDVESTDDGRPERKRAHRAGKS